MKKTLLLLMTAFGLQVICGAQTASSLFWIGGGQVEEISVPDNGQFRKLGHHGPAVENCMMGLRIYFNDKGAIDVYSKSGAQMELSKYGWYPTAEQMEKEGAGCDEYFVGNTLGLGGIALWDGEKMQKLVITKGKTARVGRTAHGNYAEVISYGVPYKGGFVDISLRVDVVDKSRDAIVSATCVSGEKVQFITGVNVNEGSQTASGKGWISVWGKHPANVSKNPIPLGGGMCYDPALFPETAVEDGMIRMISVPSVTVRTRIVSGSTKETELCDFKSFTGYVKSMAAPSMTARLGGEIDDIAYSTINDQRPINTVEHFEAAIDAGFKRLKTDMRLTADGEIVLCHDPAFTLDGNGRITGYDKRNAGGRNLIINEMTLAQVKALEHAKYQKQMGHYAHVATLEEFFRLCKKHDMPMYTTFRNEKQVETVKRYAELVKKCKVENLIMVNNYVASDETLAAVRAAFPGMPYSYTINSAHTPVTRELIDKLAADGHCVLSVAIRDVEKIPGDVWAYIREKAVPVYGHFVYSREDYLYGVSMGLAGFQLSSKACIGK